MIRTIPPLALASFAILLSGCLLTDTHRGWDGPLFPRDKDKGGLFGRKDREGPFARLRAKRDDRTPADPTVKPMPAPEPPFGPPTPAMPPAADPAKPPAAKDREELKSLLEAASKAWKALDNFEAQLTRRELNPKGKTSDEVLVFQFRRDPLAIYTRNTGEASNGRELIYFPSKHGDKIYVKLGKGDQFPGAGFVAPPVSPDDKRVTAESRYSVREVGFDRTIDKLTNQFAKIQDGKLPADTLVYEGTVKRDEYPHPLVGVTQKIKAGEDPLFPKGGTRHVYFDMKKDSPSFGLPVLSFATDDSGKEVEYYLFEKVKSPAGLTDADFHPDRRKKK